MSGAQPSKDQSEPQKTVYSAHKSRWLTGLPLFAGTLTLVLWGPVWLWALVLAVASGLAMWEYQRMVLHESPLGMWAAGVALAVAVPLLSCWRPGGMAGALGFGLALVVVNGLFRQDGHKDILAGLIKQGFGLFYCGLGFGCLALLAAMPQGRMLVLFTILSVVAADVGAYYAGHKWGRHKLSPRLSPGKTWEGFFGGLVLAGMAGAVMGATGALPYGVFTPLVGAMVLAAMSVAGDLFESLIKRSVGVKDSGNILPGHGGILDRLDGLLLAAPVLYLIQVMLWQ
jgi:phosphatidate cytidylyltransferase